MEIVAHALWASAAVITAKKRTKMRISLGWTIWWGTFPDVLAFGPSIVFGLWLLLTGSAGSVPAGDPVLPHVHIGPPLYPAAHSLLAFLTMSSLATVLTRRVVFSMLGWLLHIVIDIPTHSLSYYATRFLWPISDYRVDGIAWWTPWLWTATYAALVAVFFLLWKTRSANHDPR